VSQNGVAFPCATLDLVRPTPEARYVVFYSLAEGGELGRYHDVHKISNMRHALTILAYEMNGAPVSVLHGAPLRLRCENELGFKDGEVDRGDRVRA
jgi:sulfoxide reductase catalytic subunit YedY